MRELGNGNINFAVIHQILSHAGVQEPVPTTQLQLELEWGPLMRLFQSTKTFNSFPDFASFFFSTITVS